jgi:hypothetical protein
LRLPQTRLHHSLCSPASPAALHFAQRWHTAAAAEISNRRNQHPKDGETPLRALHNRLSQFGRFTTRLAWRQGQPHRDWAPSPSLALRRGPCLGAWSPLLSATPLVSTAPSPTSFIVRPAFVPAVPSSIATIVGASLSRPCWPHSLLLARSPSTMLQC